jgi:hypothetical protein
MNVACSSLGRVTKVQNPEDPVTQKERARKEERQKDFPRTAEAGARHREYSTVHHVLVLRGSSRREVGRVAGHGRVALLQPFVNEHIGIEDHPACQERCVIRCDASGAAALRLQPAERL